MKINKTKKNNISLIIKNIFIILIIFLSSVESVSATGDTVFYFTIPLKNGTLYTPAYSDDYNVSKNKDAFKYCNDAKNLLTNSEAYGGTEAEKQIELQKECFYKIIDSETGKEYVNPVDFTPKNDEPPSPDVYTLLAPIGDFKTAPEDIGSYFNTIFNIALGLCAVLAVIMIVIGGVQYMGDESIFGKTEAKDRIKKAIFGLLIALGSYALLNTINPDLLGGRGVTIKSVSVEIVNLPDVGDSSVDSDFLNKTGNYSYDKSSTISPGVASAVEKLKNGWTINFFKVFPNNRMLISLIKDSVVDNSNIITIAPGLNDYAEIGEGKTQDKKTPKGSWKIIEIRTPGNGIPVFSSTGSNMGASFWLLNPMTNGERGIGMHGNKNGNLTKTNGCIRLKNSDILALLPYIKTGIPVLIND